MPTYRAAGTRLATKSSAGAALGVATDVVAFHAGDAVAAIHAWHSNGITEGRRGKLR